MSSDGLWVQQMGSANRALSDKESWKKSAIEWHAYGEQLQRDLEVKADQVNGLAGIRVALLNEIKKNLPTSPLVDVAERSKIFNAAVNESRVKRNLQPLSEQELAKL